MDSNVIYPIYWIILIMMFWLVLFIIPRFLLRKAMMQVIRIFRNSRSVCSENGGARTLEELGLSPGGVFERIFRPRDYRPYAVQALMNAGILRVTHEGKVCLLEDRLPEFFQTNQFQ